MDDCDPTQKYFAERCPAKLLSAEGADPSPRRLFAQQRGAGRKKAITRLPPSLTRAWAAARPHVPASWEVKDENAYALRERHEREGAMHETAGIEHCYGLRQ